MCSNQPGNKARRLVNYVSDLRRWIYDTNDGFGGWGFLHRCIVLLTIFTFVRLLYAKTLKNKHSDIYYGYFIKRIQITCSIPDPLATHSTYLKCQFPQITK